MSIIQAVISRTTDGQWKITFHSKDRVELSLIGTLDAVKAMLDVKTENQDRWAPVSLP